MTSSRSEYKALMARSKAANREMDAVERTLRCNSIRGFFAGHLPRNARCIRCGLTAYEMERRIKEGFAKVDAILANHTPHPPSGDHRSGEVRK